MTPTARTLAWLRKAGFTVASVEKWIPQIRRRQDLFNFLDLVAMKEDATGLLGLQVTDGSNHSHRRTKILAEPNAKLWVQTGNRIWIVSWKKCGPRGKPKRWEPRCEKIELGMFPESLKGAG